MPTRPSYHFEVLVSLARRAIRHFLNVCSFFGQSQHLTPQADALFFGLMSIVVLFLWPALPSFLGPCDAGFQLITFVYFLNPFFLHCL
jgi:hypothetical protein